MADTADDVSETAEDLADRARDRAPSGLVALLERATAHNVLMLAAGLAFFGLISIGPAIGIGFGLLQLLTPAETGDQVVDLLRDTFPEQLGFGELLEQMEDRGARYAGIGLLVLLWPATTLASGWTRALDDVAEVESDGAVRGLAGRLRGLGIGLVLALGMLVLVATVTFGTALAGDGLVLVLALAAGALVLQVGLNTAVYRWLPSERRPWSTLWPGALWSTLGVALSTAGLALALTFGEELTDSYPPTLITSLVLGMWLYGANASLLLGAEHNEVRRQR
jgi:membrane protein